MIFDDAPSLVASVLLRVVTDSYWLAKLLASLNLRGSVLMFDTWHSWSKRKPRTGGVLALVDDLWIVEYLLLIALHLLHHEFLPKLKLLLLQKVKLDLLLMRTQLSELATVKNLKLVSQHNLMLLLKHSIVVLVIH